ncbi:MAG: hypothetical protein Q7T81_17665 [Pseudolabrys sp.]|nr:hypothetical protein [Pseudolabrys sp.]
MMAAIFAALLLAFVAGWFGRATIAVGLVLVCFFLSIGLFLFEVYSPQTGFRMPWLQTEHSAPTGVARS